MDDQQVWSVTCFYTARNFRRKGVSIFLIRQAIEHVRKNGGKILEGYPTITEGQNITAVDAYTGVLKVFIDLGFELIADRDARYPIV